MIDLDTLLDRRHTADALTAAGFPIAASTLATKATRGRGATHLHLVRSPAALQMGRRTLVGAITSIAPGCDFVGASRTGDRVIHERESNTRSAGGGPGLGSVLLAGRTTEA